MTVIKGMVLRGITECIEDLVAGNRGADRQVTCRQRLPQANDVRIYSCLLVREHGAGPAEACCDFIYDQKDAVLLALISQVLEKGRWVNAAARGALHQWLHNARGDPVCLGFEIEGRGMGSGVGVGIIGWHRELSAGESDALKGLVKGIQEAEGNRRQRVAMIGLREKDKLSSIGFAPVVPVLQRDFQCSFNGTCSIAGKMDVVRSIGEERHELFGKCFGRWMRKVPKNAVAVVVRSAPVWAETTSGCP